MSYVNHRERVGYRNSVLPKDTRPKIEPKTSEFKVQGVIHYFTPTASVNNVLTYTAYNMRSRDVIAIIMTQNVKI